MGETQRCPQVWAFSLLLGLGRLGSDGLAGADGLWLAQPWSGERQPSTSVEVNPAIMLGRGRLRCWSSLQVFIAPAALDARGESLYFATVHDHSKNPDLFDGTTNQPDLEDGAQNRSEHAYFVKFGAPSHILVDR